MPLNLKQTFLPIILILTECVGDGIESRLPFKIFSTLNNLQIEFSNLVYCVIAGQLVSSEVLMASELGCPIEMHRIPIEKCDEMYDPECKGDTFMPFHRALYDKDTGQSPNTPREQVRKPPKLHISSIVL